MFQLQLIIQAVLAALCQRLKVGNNCNQIWEQISDIWLWPAQQLSLKKASCKSELPQSFAYWRVGGIEAWCLILSRTVFGYPEILLNVDHAPVWPCRNWKPKACFTLTTQLQLLFVCSHLFIARLMKTRLKMLELMPIQTSKLLIEDVLCYMSQRLPPSHWLYHFHFPSSTNFEGRFSLRTHCWMHARSKHLEMCLRHPSRFVCAAALCFHCEQTQQGHACTYFFEEKDVLKLYSDMISKLSEGLTRQGFLELFPGYDSTFDKSWPALFESTGRNIYLPKLWWIL